jgi:hypothetical protein
MGRRAATLVLALLCATVVVGYQATRPARAASDPKVFVPASGAFDVLPDGFRLSIAHAYWLYTVQYYGEHLETDYRFDSLPDIVDLVVTLSPRFRQAYISGAFALIDAGRPDLGYKLLQRGFEQFPQDWHFAHYIGFFLYAFTDDKTEGARLAGEWYAKAAELPGAPAWTGRIAADLLSKGGDVESSLLLWTHVYAEGDKYSRQRALAEMDALLSKEPDKRATQLAALEGEVPKDVYEALVEALTQ